jgi:hypothetical protein
MHEMGHVQDFRSSPVRKNILYNMSGMADRGLKIAVPAAILAGGAVKDLIPGTYDDKVIDALQTVGPEAWLGAKTVSTLWPELKASINSNKILSSVAAAKGPGWMSPDALRKMKISNYLPFGRYALNSLIPYGLMAGARWIMNKRKEEEPIQKESAAVDRIAGWITNQAKGAYREGKYIGKTLFVQPGTSLLSMARNPGYVMSPMVAPNVDNLADMFRSPTARQLLIHGVAPVAVGTLLLASLNKKKQAEALAKTDAKNSTYLKLLNGKPVSDGSFGPIILDSMLEGIQ